MEDAPWIRAKIDGPLGQWHMPAGETGAGVLTACDRPLGEGAQIEERSVRVIPRNERRPVCQGVLAAREQSGS